MEKKTRNIIVLVVVVLLGALLAFQLVKPNDTKKDNEVVENTPKPEITEAEKEEALEAKYVEAMEIAKTDKKKAGDLLFELGDYKDSLEKVEEFKYDYAQELYADKKYTEAYKIFVGLGNYKDSQDMIVELRPLKGN